MNAATVLKGHELLKHLSMEEVDKINTFAERKKYGKGEVLFRQSEKASDVFVLLSGSVLLHLAANPEEFRIAIAKIEKGELFGLSPLLGSESYTAEAQCTEDSDVLAIDAQKLRALLHGDCLAGFCVMSEVAQSYFHRYIGLLGRLQGVVSQIPMSAAA